MSYTALAVILSLIYGFVGMLFFVFGNAGKDNAFRIIWGSLVFWVFLTILALLTTGWTSALSSLTGGSLIFAIEADTLGLICFTYGRVVLELANSDLMAQTRLARPLRYVGIKLQDWQDSLAGCSLLVWLVRQAARVRYCQRGEKP
jgi:hypothetical protein